MTDTTAPRANRYGSACPPWCETDHDQIAVPARVAGERDLYYRSHLATAGLVDMGDSYVNVHAVQHGFEDSRPGSAYVQVLAGDVSVTADAVRARDLAALVEKLAYMPPGACLELAGLILGAAGVIEAGNGN